MYKSFGRIVVNIAVASSLAAFAGCQSNPKVQPAPQPALSQADKQFVLDTEKTGTQERALGEFVKTKSRNKQVKQYADVLIKDESEVLRKIDAIKQKYQVGDSETKPPSPETQFKGLSRQAVDRQFVKLVVQDQQNALRMLQEEAGSASDNDVRSYASDTLPVLKNDLQKAQDLETRLAPSGKKVRASAGKRPVTHSASF